MAKIKCSELAKLVYNLARMEASSPDVKSLDDVVAKMRERLPELDRQRVVDSIIEATTGQASTRTEFQQKLGELKSEAKKDKKLRDEVKNLQDALAGKVKRTKKKPTPKPTPEAIAKLKAERDILKSQVEAMESPEGLQKLAREYAKQYVAAGITDREALLTAVHNELSAVFPDISRRTVMDSISGYANYSELSKEEIDVQLRDLRGQYQQLAKLEDMAAGQAPKKTGQERRDMSDAERELVKQVNEAKKAGGYNVTDPARQLKTSLDATKTRLRNEIRDLDKQIRSGEKIIRERKPTPTDDEVKKLTAERDKLRKQYDETFPKQPNEAARIDAAIKATERTLADLERRLREGDNTPRQTTPVTSPRLEELRQKRDQMRADLNERFPRETPEWKRTANAIKTVERAIFALEKKLAEGPGTKQQTRPVQSTPQLDALRKRRDELAGQWREISKTDLTDAQRVEIAKRATQRSIDELTRKLQERDFGRRQHKVAPVTPELAELRRQRDELRNQYDSANPNRPNLVAMRERLAVLSKHLAEGTLPPPGKPRTQDESPEAAQLREALGNVQEALKNSEPAIRQKYQHSIDRYTKRLAENDFAPPVNRADFLESPEIERLRYERDTLRKRIQQKIRGAKPKSIAERIADPLNAARAVITSLDLSAVFRQGGIATVSHPILALKNFAPMARAFVSQQYTQKVEREILQRPNAPLYARAKLYLATDDAALSQREEAYATSLIERASGKASEVVAKIGESVPIVAKVAKLSPSDPITGSANAYKTFLNKMRADLFDQIVDALGIYGEVTLDEAKVVAHFINVATGRGSLGQFEQSATLLNTAFFAPKYAISRFQFLLGQPLMGGGKATWRVRRAIAKEYAKYAMGISIFLGLAALYFNNDDDEETSVSFDTRSSDFGKIKIGNTRLDPLSGLSQATVLLSRVATGERTGIDGKVKDTDAAAELGRFLRYKLSPVVGATVNAFSGKDPVGGETSFVEEARKLVIPLSVGEIGEALKDQGLPKGTVVSLLALLGMGLGVYGDQNSNTSETTTEEAAALP